MKSPAQSTFLAISLLLTCGVIMVSLTGLLTPDFYHRETLNWQAQSLGQDLIDLILAVPLLLMTGLLIWQKDEPRRRALWGGTVLYLLYTFCLYSFDVHFNSLFLIYCINLGLSFYGLLFLMYSSIGQEALPWLENVRLRKTTSWYLILLAILFYGLWLMDVIPAMITGVPPQSLLDVGLPTNGVHVIDLSVFLPGMLITGLLIRRKHPLGSQLGPILLTFMILMDMTIGGLTLFMIQKGLPGQPAIAVIMFALAIISLFLLIRILRQSVLSEKTIRHDRIS